MLIAIEVVVFGVQYIILLFPLIHKIISSQQQGTPEDNNIISYETRAMHENKISRRDASDCKATKNVKRNCSGN